MHIYVENSQLFVDGQPLDRPNILVFWDVMVAAKGAVKEELRNAQADLIKLSCLGSSETTLTKVYRSTIPSSSNIKIRDLLSTPQRYWLAVINAGLVPCVLREEDNFYLYAQLKQ